MTALFPHQLILLNMDRAIILPKGISPNANTQVKTATKRDSVIDVRRMTFILNNTMKTMLVVVDKDCSSLTGPDEMGS